MFMELINYSQRSYKLDDLAMKGDVLNSILMLIEIVIDEIL